MGVTERPSNVLGPMNSGKFQIREPKKAHPNLLELEGDTHGFNGDISSLKKGDDIPAPGPYIYEHTDGSVNDDQICPRFWRELCPDDAVPKVAPISSPVCSQPPHPPAKARAFSALK
ncbi:uncharacterized protein BP5553_06674 [Venustampulla echinocandica]|uniref:Uncharacterized protein n=1 Tax=Venustampulla echinocandica TaxID=2656787 RepID=A0A370TKL1_9HELO|nr:uncharacterized protein BP5553_06674 [Venustampulla echinocandica]RDL36062.1 hypothetical protein BP5553_06674 [Venustampulla echinocandica]